MDFFTACARSFAGGHVVKHFEKGGSLKLIMKRKKP